MFSKLAQRNTSNHLPIQTAPGVKRFGVGTDKELTGIVEEKVSYNKFLSTKGGLIYYRHSVGYIERIATATSQGDLRAAVVS